MSKKKQEEYMKHHDDKMLEAAFRSFDRDGNGRIDANELGTVLRILDSNPREGDLKRFIRKYDSDQSGFIELEEFKECVRQSEEQGSFGDNYFQTLLMAFKYFDKDQDGYLTVQELIDVCTQLGDRMSRAEVLAFLEIADKNKDQKLDIVELVDALQSYQKNRVFTGT